MQHVSLRRRWRERPDPIAGMRPLVFYADADDLQVSTVHVVYEANSSSKALASFRSSVSKPSVNHP